MSTSAVRESVSARRPPIQPTPMHPTSTCFTCALSRRWSVRGICIYHPRFERPRSPAIDGRPLDHICRSMSTGTSHEKAAARSQGDRCHDLVVAGGLVWRARDRGVFAEPAGEPFSSWDIWRAPDLKGTPLALVAAGILASNPHNTQPWIFRVRDSEIEVSVDTRRHLGTFDPYCAKRTSGSAARSRTWCWPRRAMGLPPRSTPTPARSSISRPGSNRFARRRSHLSGRPDRPHRPRSMKPSRGATPTDMRTCANGRFPPGQSTRSRPQLQTRNCVCFSMTMVRRGRIR